MIAPDLAASADWTAMVIISVYWLGVIVTWRGGIGVVLCTTLGQPLG